MVVCRPSTSDLSVASMVDGVDDVGWAASPASLPPQAVRKTIPATMARRVAARVLIRSSKFLSGCGCMSAVAILAGAN